MVDDGTMTMVDDGKMDNGHDEHGQWQMNYGMHR